MVSIDCEDCKNLLNLQNCRSLEYGSPKTKLCIICAEKAKINTVSTKKSGGVKTAENY